MRLLTFGTECKGGTNKSVVNKEDTSVQIETGDLSARVGDMRTSEWRFGALGSAFLERIPAEGSQTRFKMA
jgi:hypothetical protein